MCSSKVSGIPAGTTELALLCVDPDAPSGTFLHWYVTGLDPATSGLDEDERPAGTVHPNNFGEIGWGGPEPPVGDGPHRYVFGLYALAAPPPVDAQAGADAIREALDAQALATATLTGTYRR